MQTSRKLVQAYFTYYAFNKTIPLELEILLCQLPLTRELHCYTEVLRYISPVTVSRNLPFFNDRKLSNLTMAVLSHRFSRTKSRLLQIIPWKLPRESCMMVDYIAAKRRSSHSIVRSAITRAGTNLNVTTPPLRGSVSWVFRIWWILCYIERSHYLFINLCSRQCFGSE